MHNSRGKVSHLFLVRFISFILSCELQKTKVHQFVFETLFSNEKICSRSQVIIYGLLAQNKKKNLKSNLN